MGDGPTRISDRRFFHALYLWGLIPQEEAMMAVQTGFIPTRLSQVLDEVEAAGMLPVGMTRFDADLIIAGAHEFLFENPLGPVIGAAFGWDEAERMRFWEFAASLK
jgi:hypothetical protein